MSNNFLHFFKCIYDFKELFSFLPIKERLSQVLGGRCLLPTCLDESVHAWNLTITICLCLPINPCAIKQDYWSIILEDGVYPNFTWYGRHLYLLSSILVVINGQEFLPWTFYSLFLGSIDRIENLLNDGINSPWRWATLLCEDKFWCHSSFS